MVTEAVVAAAPALDAVPTSPAKQQMAGAALSPSKAVVAAAASSSPAPAPPAPPSTSTPAPAQATPAAERDAQKSYWEQHSKVPTVEAMMLDSKAAEIDRMERPEVRVVLSLLRGRGGRGGRGSSSQSRSRPTDRPPRAPSTGAVDLRDHRPHPGDRLDRARGRETSTKQRRRRPLARAAASLTARPTDDTTQNQTNLGPRHPRPRRRQARPRAGGRHRALHGRSLQRGRQPRHGR